MASVLNIGIDQLVSLSENPVYRVFPIKEQTCPFTGKVTKERIVQEPTDKLRRIHERIQSLLTRVTTPHYVHAAVKGRSYRTNAAAHKDGKWVATFDITKFYPSTPEHKVFDFFSSKLGCASDVASLLSKIVCYKTANGNYCLPTGSPLSPILSVYANFQLFDSFERFAIKHELKFTCYVDDVTFSGDKLPPGLTQIVKSMMRRHGHSMSEKKTRIFGPGQAKHVTGTVLKSGKIYVPFSRFKKARRIQLAIRTESDAELKLQLHRKLTGLLGEAAFLDERYKNWAKASYSDLATNQQSLSHLSPSDKGSS